MKDIDLLVALDYLLTNHRDALTKWAWGGTTNYIRLNALQREVEKGKGLSESNRNNIQRIFSSKRCVGCKIEEWPELEKHHKVYQERLNAKKIMTSSLEGKVIPVNFKRIDKYGNAIGWISLQGVDETLPSDIKSRVFIMKVENPDSFKTGFVYNTVCTGVTSNGAIKVKPI